MKTHEQVKRMLQTAVDSRRENFIRQLTNNHMVDRRQDEPAVARIHAFCEVLENYTYNGINHELTQTGQDPIKAETCEDTKDDEPEDTNL